MKSLITSEVAKGLATELLTAREAAALLAVSDRHLFRLADAGQAPAPKRLGRAVRWSRAELMAWIAAGCPRVTTEGR